MEEAQEFWCFAIENESNNLMSFFFIFNIHGDRPVQSREGF